MNTGKFESFNNTSVTRREQYLQFSKEPIMSNFGELPFGEIPEPLKYVRPFSKLSLFNLI